MSSRFNVVRGPQEVMANDAAYHLENFLKARFKDFRFETKRVQKQTADRPSFYEVYCLAEKKPASIKEQAEIQDAASCYLAGWWQGIEWDRRPSC